MSVTELALREEIIRHTSMTRDRCDEVLDRLLDWHEQQTRAQVARELAQRWRERDIRWRELGITQGGS